MNPLRLLVLLVSLPLLLGGCGENVVNDDEIEPREGVVYLKGSENPYTGKAIALWENGQERSGGIYKDGKPDGLWLRWHKNGKKRSEDNWKDGKRDGLFVQWNEVGQKEAEVNFKDGKEDGLALMWHENGQKKAEGNWKDDKVVEGSRKVWNSKGEPVDSLEEAK